MVENSYKCKGFIVFCCPFVVCGYLANISVVLSRFFYTNATTYDSFIIIDNRKTILRSSMSHNVIQDFITTTHKINGHIPTVTVSNYDASVVKKCERKADLRKVFL